MFFDLGNFFRVLLIGRMTLPGLHNVHHELLKRIWVEKNVDHEILWWMEPKPVKNWNMTYL